MIEQPEQRKLYAALMYLKFSNHLLDSNSKKLHDKWRLILGY